MSYIPSFFTEDNLDAFARLRTSSIQSLFESKQIHDKQPLFWDEAFVSGGTSTHSATDARSRLTVPATNGASAIRQTYMRFPYQAGKSSIIVTTFVPVSGTAGTTDITRRVGLFDGTSPGFGGIFYELADDTPAWCIAKDGTIDRVTKPNWNLNPDLVLDATKTCIAFFDFEWLGVGRVRCGFFIDGIPNYVHEFNHAGVVDAVYMSTPNLPLRFELTSQGGAGSLDAICTAVSVEGGSDPVGVTRMVSTALDVSDVSSDGFINASSTGDRYAICGYRVDSGANGAVLIPEEVSVFAKTNDALRWTLQLNPTLSGTLRSSPTLDNSQIEALLSEQSNGSAMRVTDDGIILDEGFVSQQRRTGSTQARPAIWPGIALDSARDEIWLCVDPLNGGLDVFGAIKVREVG